MSLLFLFQGIAANMEVCKQIEDISHFIFHYQDHKEEGDSFLEYVYEDYINGDAQDHEHQEDSDHEDSPFHSCHQCCQHVVFFTSFQLNEIASATVEQQRKSDYYTFQINSRYLEALFQPPRV